MPSSDTGCHGFLRGRQVLSQDWAHGTEIPRDYRHKDFHFLPRREDIVSFTMKDSQNLVYTDGIDLVTFGQRLRHLRRIRGLTLTELGERIDRAPSVLSLIENGRREPKLSLIEQLAAALSVPLTELLSRQPPSRRAQLEIALADAQQDPSYRRLGLPQLKIGARVPTDVLEHLVAVASELRAQQSKPAATPEEARAANAALREAMRERGNYFEVIEREAADSLRTVGYSGGALSQGMLVSVVSHHGFAIRFVQDLRQAGAGRGRFTARGRPAGPRSLPARPPGTPRLRRLPAAAGGGELLRRRRPHAGNRGGSAPRPRQDEPGSRGGGPGRPVLGVLRDGGAPVHQPGHASPGPAVSFREERRERHHLQGLRERRRGLPGRPVRRDRGTAALPAVVRQAGVRGRRPLLPVLPVLRHAVGQLFLRRPGGPARRPRVRHHARRPVRALPLVPRPRGDHQDTFGLPGRRVLQPAAGRAGRAV